MKFIKDAKCAFIHLHIYLNKPKECIKYANLKNQHFLLYFSRKLFFSLHAYFTYTLICLEIKTACENTLLVFEIANMS